MPRKKTLKQRILAAKCPRCKMSNGRKCKGTEGTCHAERLHAWQASPDGVAHAKERGINLAEHSKADSVTIL